MLRANEQDVFAARLRYTDGVIQASILRCCIDHELDYRGIAHASDALGTTILRMLGSLDKPSSEAILEFLLALAIRRLQFAPRVEMRVATAALAITEESPRAQAIRLLATVIRDNHPSMAVGDAGGGNSL